MAIKNLAQSRARFAYSEVSNIIGKNWAKEFKSHVKDIPMMIKTNGLAATYAFVFSNREKEHYQKIMDISRDWLVDQQHVFELGKHEDFFKKLLDLDTPHYRLAAREILSLFTWLKRYADGLINPEEQILR